MVQKSKGLESSLEVRLGHEIPPKDYGILAAILNSAWGWLFEATPEIIEKRLQSGHPFVVAYGQKQPDEQIEGDGSSPYDGQKMPIVFLETVALRTEGKFKNIPTDYFSLTNSGLWQPKSQNPNGDYFAPLSDRLWHPGSKDPDTIMMVDLTGTPLRRRVTEEVSRLVEFTIKSLSGQNDHNLPFDPVNIHHIWTYSPDRPGVLRMHERNGARDTGFIIPQSRVPRQYVSYLNGTRTVDPSFSHPLMDTHIVSYKG